MATKASPQTLSGTWPEPTGALRPVVLVLLALILALFLVERFHGIFPNLYQAFHLAADATLYAHDPGAQNSLLGRSSILLEILRAFSLDATRPLTNVTLYLAVAALGAYGCVLINRDVFGMRGPALHMLLLAFLVLGDGKNMTNLKISWLAIEPFSITMVAVALRLFALYFLLTQRYGLAVAAEALVMAISVKSGWMLWLVLALVIIADRPRHTLALLAGLAGALIYPLVQATAALSGGLTPDEARRMFEVVAAAYAAEDNPFAIGPMAMAATAGTLWAAWWLAPRVAVGAPDHVTRVTRITVIASAAVFLAGGLYITFGYRLLPIPALVLLSPARAMEVQSFLFYSMAVIWLLKSPSLDNLSRTALLVALALVRMQDSRPSFFILAALAIAAAATGWLFIRQRVPDLTAFADRVLPFGRVMIVLALFFLSAIAYFRLDEGRQMGIVDFDPKLGFVARRVPPSARVMLAELRAELDRGPVMFVTNMDGKWVEPLYLYWNGLAKVSALSGELYYLSHAPTVWRKVAARNVVAARLLDQLNGADPAADADPDAAGLRARFADYHAMVVAPEEAAAHLADWPRCQAWPGWVALVPTAEEARRRGCPS